MFWLVFGWIWVGFRLDLVGFGFDFGLIIVIISVIALQEVLGLATKSLGLATLMMDLLHFRNFHTFSFLGRHVSLPRTS